MLEKITEKIQLLPRKPKENEVLCEVCGGIGHLINNQEGYIERCTSCRGLGIKDVCKICGQPKYGLCENMDCRKEIDRRDEQRLLNKAIKCELKDISSEYTEMFYSESYRYNDGYFSEIEDLIEYCESEDIEIPDYVWATQKVDLQLDACDILENACEELCEDAFDNLTDINGLQKLLDEWVSKQSGQNTYYPNYRYAIKVDKK